MKIIYKNTLEDYNNYIKFNLDNLSKLNKFLVPSIFLIGAIYESINSYYYYKLNDVIYLNRSLKNIFIFIILAIIFFIFIKNIIWIIFKLDLKLNKYLFKEKSLELKEEYILYKISNLKIKAIKYSKIKKIVETKDCIYILRKSINQSYMKTPIIPTNVFSNETEKKEFINFIKKCNDTKVT